MHSDTENSYDAYAVLRNHEFRLFVAMRFFLTLGIQIQSTIVGWQIYEITNDPLSLGLIGLAEAVPFMSVILYGGHLADLYSRKKLIVWALCAYLIGAGLLFFFTLRPAEFANQYGTLPIYAVVFLTGLARGFGGPAISAFVTQLVPRGQYTNASTWNTTFWQIAAVSGPALGGLIYAFAKSGLPKIVSSCLWLDKFENAEPGLNYGGIAAFGTVIVLVLVAIGCLLFIRAKPIQRSENRESLGRRLADGVRFVFGNQIILSALTLDLFAVFFGGAVALLPIFAKEIITVGPDAWGLFQDPSVRLGLLRASPSVGAALMGLVLAHRPPLRDTGRKLLFYVAGFGVCMILFALSTDFYLSFVVLAASGALDGMSVVIRSTILQLTIPDQMRGRVSAVNSIFVGSSNEIGSFESGVAARLLGLVPSVIFGGCMTLAVVAVTARVAPQLRNLQMKSIEQADT